MADRSPSDPPARGDYGAATFAQVHAALFSGEPESMTRAANTIMESGNQVLVQINKLPQTVDSLLSRWQGPAADEFRKQVDWFLVELAAENEKAGNGGLPPVVTSLYDSAQTLAWGQDTLDRIQQFYAQQAAANGASLTTGPDGKQSVAVGSTPGIGEQIQQAMDEDARFIMQQAADRYAMSSEQVLAESGHGEGKDGSSSSGGSGSGSGKGSGEGSGEGSGSGGG